MATLVEIVKPTVHISPSGVKYTNKHNLPPQLVNAIMKDRYTVEGEKDSDYSVSRLVVPIQQLILTRRYPNDLIVRDVIHYWKSFLGSVIHTVAEEGHQVESDAIVEQRFYMTILGLVVSGKFDCYENCLINDYKSTGTYKLQKQDYLDWEITVNLYAEFCRQNNLPVEALMITYFALDWKEHECWKENYPKTPMGIIPLPLWSRDKAMDYMTERVRRLELAKDLDADKLAKVYPCSNRDMWKNFKDFCLKRKDSDRATKTFTTKEAALLYFKQETDKKGSITEETHEVIERYDRRKRCFDWCDVAHHCTQFRETNLKEGVKWERPDK